MVRLFLILMALVGAAAPAAAQRPNAIQPELVAETRGIPGGVVELAIVMHTSPGWHGYWLNPGDAGLPMSIEWQLPAGSGVGPLRYPVPQRLTVAGIMNYVYEQDYALLTRLTLPADASGVFPIRAKARWLACTDKVCVPEQGEFALDLPTTGTATADPRFNDWRQALPRPLATPAKFAVNDKAIRVAIPLPAALDIEDPYVFAAVDGPIDYAGEQRFRRAGDALIAELPRRNGPPTELAGVLALKDGSGFEFRAVPGQVPSGGTPIGGLGAKAILLAVLGALAGGILLNLMPCVFPILGLKAMHLAKSGGSERSARRDALAYAAGAIVGTGALGLGLLAIRAGGSAAGWAFQLQDPRTVLLLTLLAMAITLNLLRVFELPVLAGEHNPAGSFGTGALAAFVATPCAGPFLGAALGTALLLPAAGSVLVFAALGLGLALPFVAIAFIPALRKRLPKPGPWMARLQRFLAIPMAVTVAAGLWLLWRQAGTTISLFGLFAAAALALCLYLAGRIQRQGRPQARFVLLLALVVVIAGVARVPVEAVSRPASTSADAWSEPKVQSTLAAGHPVFVYFTADWCLTCKANEIAAIGRDEVQQAFKSAGVTTLVGDWTNGDPVITKFLESRGRAGVPLYLWYEPGKEAEELPQILTPAMLTTRARRAG
jgi:DsbC/DsbD-like thiol-disulfide interchange protein/cytochrome c biogenesis protein CcdA